MKWTKKKKKQLEQLYGMVELQAIARFFECFESDVYLQADKMGLTRISARYGRFMKGHNPWNKGKKGVNTGGQTSQFKPGQKPINTKPVGAITSRRSCTTLYIKIAEPNVWEELRRNIWKKHHGDIPDGMVIRHKDGDWKNCDIENLEMISNRENRLLNSASHNMTDGWVAGSILGMRAPRKDRQELLKYPDLIEIKRRNLQLNRHINGKHPKPQDTEDPERNAEPVILIQNQAGESARLETKRDQGTDRDR